MNNFYKYLKSLHRFICPNCNERTNIYKQYESPSMFYIDYFCECMKISIHHSKWRKGLLKENTVYFSIININNFQFEIKCLIDKSNTYQYQTYIYYLDLDQQSKKRYKLIYSFKDFPNIFLNNSSSDQIINYLQTISNFL